MVSVDRVLFYDELRAEMIRLLQLSKVVADSGLVSVVPKEERMFPGFAEIISKSEHLTVVINYGKDWVSNWREILANRFRDDKKETDYFLLDPESPFVNLLAEKQHTTATAIKNKIDETVIDLARMYKDRGGKGPLRVHYIKWPLFPTISIFLAEGLDGGGKVAFSLYTISSYKGAVPLLVFQQVEHNESVYAEIVEDVNRLKNNSILHIAFPAMQIEPSQDVRPEQ